MPTYEYECQKCQHKFEVFQSMTAKVLDKCPKCSGRVKRLISAGGGIIFKGKKKEEVKPCEKANPCCPPSCPKI